MSTLTPAEQAAVDWTRTRKSIRDYLSRHPNAACTGAPNTIAAEYRHLRGLVTRAKLRYEDELDAESRPIASQL